MESKHQHQYFLSLNDFLRHFLSFLKIKQIFLSPERHLFTSGDVSGYIEPSVDRQECQGVVRSIRGWPSVNVRVSAGLTWVSQGISVSNQGRLGIPQWMSGMTGGCQGLYCKLRGNPFQYCSRFQFPELFPDLQPF